MLTPPLLALLAAETILALLFAVPWRPVRRIPVMLVGFFKGAAMRVVVSTVAALLLVLLLVGGAQLWQLQQRLSDPTAAGMFASGAGGGGFHEARVELLQAAVQEMLLGALGGGEGGGGLREGRRVWPRTPTHPPYSHPLPPPPGYGLLLGLVIGQLAGSIREGEVAALSIATLKKQAQGLQDEYMRLANERSGERGVEEEAVKKARGLKDSIARLEKDIRHKEVRAWNGCLCWVVWGWFVLGVGACGVICRKVGGSGGFGINIGGDARTMQVQGEEHLATYRAKMRGDTGEVRADGDGRARWMRGREGWGGCKEGTTDNKGKEPDLQSLFYHHDPAFLKSIAAVPCAFPPSRPPPKVTESGAQRRFCRECGSHLWLYDPRWPDLIHPYASAIDSPLPPPPERTHLMLNSKPAWVQASVGPTDKSFQGYPEESLADWHMRTGVGQ
ncbi:unnamed protein product [Closterium sp. NIES-53]